MRLDKFISNNSAFSRSDVRKLVKAERIQVNGEIAPSHDIKIRGKKDKVTVDGERVEPLGDVYLMLNKPEGYVSATEDSEHPTVIDLLRDQSNFIGDKTLALPFKDLQIVGRLDIDTTGLLLITTDGKWNHAVTAPAANCKKVYRVTLKNAIAPSAPELFAKGIQLEGEKKKTRPAFIDAITPKKVRLAIFEGKYHQVKRMFAATGNTVKKLHRESVGGVTLDEDLSPGQFRLLSNEEVNKIADRKTLSNVG